MSGWLLLVAASIPAVVVGAWAFTRPALTEDVATRSDRAADGTVFGILALVGAVVVAVLVAWVAGRSPAPERRRHTGRGLVVVAVLCVIAASAAVSVAAADAVTSGRDCSEVVNDPSRLGSLDPNNRLCWWEEAWDVFVEHAPEGAGAGTFEVARKRFRPDERSVAQPPSVPLQQLADGGVVALGLFALVILAGVAVCVCALRRLSGAERAAAVALVAAPAAYLVYALVDFNWDFIAVTAPTMVALGVLAGAGRDERAGGRHPLLAIGVVLVAAAVIVSFSFPRLADRAERRRPARGRRRRRALDQAARRVLQLGLGDPLYARARGRASRYRLACQRAHLDAAPGPTTRRPGTRSIFQFDIRRTSAPPTAPQQRLHARPGRASGGAPARHLRDAVSEGGAPGS